MGLIEGLDDAIAGEYVRLRDDIRAAIAASGYTHAQVAALAGVGERTLRNILAGSHAAQIDTLFRIAFVLGARVELALPAAGERPFQVVPLATGSRRSSASSAARGAANIAAKRRTKARKKASEQRGRRSSKHGETPVYNDLAA